MDVNNCLQIAEIVAEVKASDGCIDIWLNNAGIVADAQLYKMTNESFDRVVDTDLKGVYNGNGAVVSKMIEQKSGVILSVE